MTAAGQAAARGYQVCYLTGDAHAFCHLLPLPSRQAVHGTEDLRSIYVEGEKKEKFYPEASPPLTMCYLTKFLVFPHQLWAS